MKSDPNTTSIDMPLISQQPIGDHFFTGVKDNVVFRMDLSGFSDEPALSIQMLYCDSQQEYELKMTKTSLSQGKATEGQFESVGDVFRLIRDHFETIKFRPQGVISISVSLNVEDDHVELRAQRCPTIKEGSLAIKDLADRISQLKLEAEERNEALLQENLSLQLTIQKRASTISDLESRVADLKNVVECQDEEIRQLREILTMVLKDGKTPRDSSVCGSRDAEKVQKVEHLRFRELVPHEGHVNNLRHFSVKGSLLTRETMTKNWQNFILQPQLAPGCINTIEFKIVKADLSSVNIGVASRSTFNQNNTRVNTDQVSYSMLGHDLWIGGKKHEPRQVSRVKAGELVSVRVDLARMVIAFFRRHGLQEEKEVVFEGRVPAHLQKKELYFFVAVKCVDDQVRLV